MAKKIPDSDDWPNQQVSQSEASGLSSSNQDIRLEREESPSPKLDYESWYADKIRSVFSSITSDLLDGLFGPVLSGPVCFRVLTDCSPQENVTDFGGEWQRNRYQRFVAESRDASVFALIKTAFDRNAGIAIMLNYRPRGSRTVFGFSGRLDTKKSRVLEFEKERGERFSAIPDAAKPTGSLVSRRFFELGELPPSAGDLIKVFVCAPNDIISQLRTEAVNQSALPGTSARFSWTDWPVNTQIIGDVFDQRGGDLLLDVALLPETCQARWVAPKQIPDSQHKESTQQVDETPELTGEQLPRRDPLSKATMLESQLLPQATPSQIRDLASAIREAGAVPKPDRERFVLAINRLLAATGRSLEVDVNGVAHRALELIVKNGSVQYRSTIGNSIGLNNPATLVKGR